jgi:hypothetical protein
MDGDDNDNGDGRMDDNDNDNNGEDGKGNGAMDDNGCLDDRGLTPVATTNLLPRVGKRKYSCNTTNTEEEAMVADLVVIHTTIKQITGRGGGRW